MSALPPLLLALTLGLASVAAAEPAATAPAVATPLRVLCTTFPVYLFTRQVAAGQAQVRIELLLAAGLGCPHDYVLTPADMHKLAGADVLVVNGLGLEEFVGQPVTRANPKIAVVSATAGLGDLLPDRDAGGGPAAGGQPADPKHQHGHRHNGVNPHVFASPRLAARMVTNLAAGLGQADPARAATYAANAKAYAARLEKLADDLAAVGKELRQRRIVTQHAVFDYLARDLGLEIVAVVETQPGQAPAAAEMLAIVKKIRETQAGAVFTEPQYSAKVGETIAQEAGVPAAALDPVASGPADAGPDYYEQTMRANLATLRQTLGTK